MVDLYPSFLRKGFRREIFIAFICSISYLLGLAMVTEVGGFLTWPEGLPLAGLLVTYTCFKDQSKAVLPLLPLVEAVARL